MGGLKLKICIIGPEKTTSTEILLINEAKKLFDKALYVPISSVRVECTGAKPALYYKDTSLLDFDIFLPRIYKKNSDMGYAILRVLEDNARYSPISSASVLLGYNEVLLQMRLSSLGIPAQNSYFAISRSALEKTVGNLKYPIVLKLPYHKEGAITIASRDTVKGIFDTVQELSQPLLVQESLKKANGLNILLIGKKALAMRDGMRVSLGKKDYESVMRARGAVGARLCEISAATAKGGGIRVQGINICPNISKYEALFGPIPREILGYLDSRAYMYYETSGILRFIKWFERGMP